MSDFSRAVVLERERLHAANGKALVLRILGPAAAQQLERGGELDPWALLAELIGTDAARLPRIMAQYGEAELRSRRFTDATLREAGRVQ